MRGRTEADGVCRGHPGTRAAERSLPATPRAPRGLSRAMLNEVHLLERAPLPSPMFRACYARVVVLLCACCALAVRLLCACAPPPPLFLTFLLLSSSSSSSPSPFFLLVILRSARGLGVADAPVRTATFARLPWKGPKLWLKGQAAEVRPSPPLVPRSRLDMRLARVDKGSCRRCRRRPTLLEMTNFDT